MKSLKNIYTIIARVLIYLLSLISIIIFYSHSSLLATFIAMYGIKKNDLNKSFSIAVNAVIDFQEGYILILVIYTFFHLLNYFTVLLINWWFNKREKKWNVYNSLYVHMFLITVENYIVQDNIINFLIPQVFSILVFMIPTMFIKRVRYFFFQPYSYIEYKFGKKFGEKAIYLVIFFIAIFLVPILKFM